MSINIGIIDQRVIKLAQDLAPEFASRLGITNDEPKKKSAAFVFLSVKTLLDLRDDEALDCLTEGGQDFGIDAVHIGDVEDREFVVTLFSGKYKQNADGSNEFKQEGVEKTIQAIRYLFDPNATLNLNPQLRAKLEEIRSLIQDGELPSVRAVMCSNGKKWNADSQRIIDLAGFPASQVKWDYVNHDEIVRLMQSSQPVNDTLRLSGKAIVEDLDFCRVLVGKIPVREIESLFIRHGDLLLERNVRRFLGYQGNRVNEAIAETLRTEAERGNFYFFNNGVTMICSKFSHNALQADNFQVRVEGLQVINGGQTCKTIQSTLAALSGADQGFENTFVMIRLYQLPSASDDFVRNVTYATNSQNPVDLRDLRSNDVRQRGLEASVAGFGYTYHRHRREAVFRPIDISSAVAAEAVLAVWRNRPYQVKYHGREHFGKLYDTIFTRDLNGAQVIIATLLYRASENRRRRPAEGAPPFVAYASAFAAMLMGRYLLAELGQPLPQLNHTTFQRAKALVEQNEAAYFDRAIQAISVAMRSLYGEQELSWQRQAATFRRGDLIQALDTGV